LSTKIQLTAATRKKSENNFLHPDRNVIIRQAPMRWLSRNTSEILK